MGVTQLAFLMKVFLLVCLGLLAVVSSGLAEAEVGNENPSKFSLKEPSLKVAPHDESSIREIREAKKEKDKKKVKSAKTKGRKNKRRQTKKNRKGNKKSKTNRRKNKKSKGKNKNDVKNRKKVKKTKSKGKVKDRKNKNKNGVKSRKNSSKVKKTKRKGKGRAKKIKTKRKKTKNGKKGRKSGKASRSQEGRLVCGDSQVNDTCLQNAVDALNFEKNQIQNFFKQKARLINHNKTTANKQGKKGEFMQAAKFMLQAIGGNISNPTCGESGTANKARSAKSSVDNYNTLLNCSNSIKEACTMPKSVFNASKKALLDNCAFIFNKSKTASDDCRTNKDYLANGTAACSCWFKAAIGIKIAKKAGCSASDTSKQVKAAKNKCIAAFSKCKKAEDAAVALIHTCMAGEVKNISATGRW